MRTAEPAWVEPPQQETIWNAPLLRAISLGHWTTIADAVWMRGIQDESLSHVSRQVRAAPYYDFDIVTSLDPAFFEGYFDGAILLVIIRDDDEGAVRLLRKSEAFRSQVLPTWGAEFRQRFWPLEWAIPTTLGYTYMFELEDLAAAAEQFRIAAQLPGAPDYLKQLGQRLEHPAGVYEVGLKTLGFMMAAAPDDRARQKLEHRRRNLFLLQFLFQINQDFVDFLREQPENNPVKVSQAALERVYARFQRERHPPSRDPFGESLYVGADGKIHTRSPVESVMGIRY